MNIPPYTWLDADVGYRTDYLGNKVPNSDFKSNSKYNKITGQWEIGLYPVDNNPYLAGSVDITGLSDPTTGAGTFLVTLPEPSSLTMLGLAVTGLLRRVSRAGSGE